MGGGQVGTPARQASQPSQRHAGQEGTHQQVVEAQQVLQSRTALRGASSAALIGVPATANAAGKDGSARRHIERITAIRRSNLVACTSGGVGQEAGQVGRGSQAALFGGVSFCAW